MASKKTKKSLHVEKERITTRLNEIKEDRDYILQHVNERFQQAEEAAASLLNETSRSKFLRKHHAVTQILNDCWREIFRVKSHLIDSKDDDESSSSSSSDESIGSLVSELSVSTVSCGSRLMDRSSLSGASWAMSPASEECPVGEKIIPHDVMQVDVMDSKKTLTKCSPIIEDECGCAGDSLAKDSSPSVTQRSPLPPCGDGLKSAPKFPNVNCTEFVSGASLSKEAIDINCADGSSVMSADINTTVSDSTPGNIESWAAWQRSRMENAPLSNLAIPETHSDGEESVDNSILSEHSMPSDRTIVGAPEEVTAVEDNINPLSEQLINVNLPEQRAPSIADSNSPSTVTMSEKNVLSPTRPLPPPAPAVANRRLISYGSSANSTCSTSSVDGANKLPSHATSTESLVSGASDLSIDNLTFREGASIEGIVTCVNSPSDVWIQVQGEQLGGLLEELSSFCSGSKSEGVGKELTEGHFCCAKCTEADSWNRAVVRKIRYKPAADSNGAPKFVVDSVDVRYIDYGSTEELSIDRLKRLKPKFFKVPAHAVCCLLGKLQPYSSKYEEWNADLTNELKDLVFGKEVKATIMKYWPGAASTVLLAIPDEGVDDVEDVLLRKLAASSVDPKKAPKPNDESEPGVITTCEEDDAKLAAKAAAKRMTDDGGGNSSVTDSKAGEVSREEFTWAAKVEKLVPNISDGFFIMLSHVNSPSSFYGHVLPESSGYLDLQEELDNTYNTLHPKPPIASVVTVNSCWCTKYTDERWYRVRVLMDNKKGENPTRRRKRISLSPADEKIFVEYIDYGNRDWVSIEDLRPLKKDHCKQPGLAVHMRLAHIFPLSMTPEQRRLLPSEWHWSAEATDVFSQMTRLGYDEMLLARHVEDEDELEQFGMQEQRDTDPLPIMLWNGSSYTTNEIINKELVNGGLAMSLKYGPETTTQTGPKDSTIHKESNTTANPLSSSEEHAKKAAVSNGNKVSKLEENEVSESPEASTPIIEELQNWNPMEIDYTSGRNSYDVDIDDAGVAALGYKYQDEKLVCRFFSKGFTCHKGNTCPFKHIYTADLTTTTDTIPTYATTNELPLPSVNTFVVAEVSAIFNPGHFYVGLPYGNKNIVQLKEPGGAKKIDGETLPALQEALKDHYSKQTHKPNPSILPAIGEIVAARYTEDNSWYRAKVLDIHTEENLVTVFFVDYGNTDWTSQEDIRALEPQFHGLPHQAVECFMSEIEPVRRSERLSWSAASRIWFQETVENKQLVLHVKSSDQVVLYVDLIDTSNDEEININSELVKLGYAQWCHVAVPKAKIQTPSKRHEMIKVPG